MNVPDEVPRPEHLSRRELVRLIIHRTLFAAVAGVAASLVVKNQPVHASTILNGAHQSTNNDGWICDCTANSTQCYCEVPPPPR